VTSAVTPYTTRLLTPDTWDDFAALVEANNGVWGGCWCIGFHPGGISKDSTTAGNREVKLAHVNNGAGRDSACWRGLGRGLPRAGGWTRPATWRLPAYRAREPVRGIRIRPRPSHRQVALGHASAHLRLEVPRQVPGQLTNLPARPPR
jgi:hypothetical protein